MYILIFNEYEPNFLLFNLPLAGILCKIEGQMRGVRRTLVTV